MGSKSFKGVFPFLPGRLQSAILAGLLSLILVSPDPLGAWGNTGHEAVAYVAWQQMTPSAQNRAIELIRLVPTLHDPTNTKIIRGFTDWVADLPAGLSVDEQNLYLFMRAATWADSIKHEWLTDSDTPPPGIVHDVNIGYTDTASHGYWHFVDRGLTSDTSAVPATPAPNAATQILALRDAIASNEADDLKSYDLVWLEHLVGDIHQPLHGAIRYFQNAGDLGGNTVKINMPAAMQKKFEGTLSKNPPRELHAFWDDLPGEGRADLALPPAAKFAKALPPATGPKTSDTDPANWATESFRIAVRAAYRTPIGASPRPATGSSYMITQTYYNTAMRNAKKQVALAGARLARLLNENLR